MRGKNSLEYGISQYDKIVRETQYQFSDKVLMWSSKIGKNEGNKMIMLEFGP